MANITLRSVKGSALSFQEADDNFNNLNTSKLESVSADTAPSLGGNLDTNSRKIVTTDSSGFIKIGNPMNLDGLPLGFPLTEDLFSAITAGANSTLVFALNNGDFSKPGIAINDSGIGLNSALGAFTPEMFVNSMNVIVGVPLTGNTDSDLNINSNGTGNVKINSIAYPKTDGTAGQVLSTNGSGVLSFTTLPSAGIATVSADTAPSLGGNLDVGANSIITTDSSGFIKIGNPLNLDGLPLASPLTEDLFSAITASANSTLVFALNNGDFSKPGIAINNNGIGLNSALGAFTPEMFVNSTNVIVGVPLTTFDDQDLVLNPNKNTVVNKMIYNETVFSLGTTSGTIAPNAANGAVQTITLNGNLTLNAFTNPVAGQSLTLIVNTGGTGRTLTSSMKFAGGEKTLSTTDTTDIISIFYDGTNYWASLAKDFK